MTTLQDDDVRHIATLARLHLKDDEVQTYAKELSAILDFITQLQEVDTTNVQATAQVTGLHNALREDEVQTSAASPEALLECSPLPIIERQIQTPSTHES